LSSSSRELIEHIIAKRGANGEHAAAKATRWCRCARQ
jgi:hypothetical protein